MTVPDTVYDTINDNWGNGGYGGDTPQIDTTETQTDHDVTSTDVIEVRHYTFREDPRPVNDKYTNRYYRIDVRVSSKTSAAQLKLLEDEAEYLLRNTTMTDVQLVNITKRADISDWEYGVHAIIMTVELVALMSSGAVTPASTSTATFAKSWPSVGDWNMGSGTSRGTLYGSTIYMPINDDNCTLFGTIILPDNWPSSKNNYLKIKYTCSVANQAYSVKWYIAADADGEVVGSYNILNGSTAYDFAAVDTIQKLAENSVNLGTSLEGGERVGIYVVSDALNATTIYILGMWIEHD